MSVEIESPKTFTLRTPIKKGEVTELTLQEPTAGDIEQMQKDAATGGDATALIKLIARQAKLSPTDIRELGARDFKAIEEYLGSFLSSGPESSES